MNFRVRLISSLILCFASLTCLAANTPKDASFDAKALWKEWPAFAAKFPEPSAAARKLAAHNARITGSEDLMSPELKKFRDDLVGTAGMTKEQLLATVENPEHLQKLLQDANANYDSYPNDLKYVVARMTPLLAMRGFFWKMIPLAAQATVTQEMLLAMVRNFSEQVMIFEPQSQWQAYLGFLSIPDATAVAQGQFKTENDFVDFMANTNTNATQGVLGPYGLLDQACTRLANLKMSVTIGGKTVPVVFDNRLRFGNQAFGNMDYAPTDRFKIAGDAERYTAIARFSRRMGTIAQIAAFDWTNNIKMRKELGERLGVRDGLLAAAAGVTQNFLSLEGLTRNDRVTISKKYPNLFAVRDASKLAAAYYYLHNYVYFSAKAWKVIRNEGDDYNYALDPELFQGRREQIDQSMLNLLAMFPDIKSRKAATIHGAIDGKTTTVDMASFFNNPNPPNLHKLMPTVFAGHSDVQPFKEIYKDMVTPSGKSEVTMKIGDQTVEWRNYLFDRATGWDVATYQTMFPSVKSPEDVAEAQRILSETRGGRPVLNSIVIFIK